MTVVDDSLPADSRERFVKEFSRPGVITGLTARTYVGEEFYLRYKFELIRPETGQAPVNLSGGLTSESGNYGEDYLAGNGDVYEGDLRQPFESGEKLRITVENATGRNGVDPYDYPIAAEVEVDYDGGLVDRLNALIGGLL